MSMLKDEGSSSCRCLYSLSTTREIASLLGLSSWSFLAMKSLTAELTLKSTCSKNVSEIMEGTHS